MCVSLGCVLCCPIEAFGESEFGHDTWKRQLRCHNDPSVCWAQPGVLTLKAAEDLNVGWCAPQKLKINRISQEVSYVERMDVRTGQ